MMNWELFRDMRKNALIKGELKGAAVFDEYVNTLCVHSGLLLNCCPVDLECAKYIVKFVLWV